MSTAAATRSREAEWKDSFIEALRMTGNVRWSCEYAAVGRRVVYLHRAEDEEFAQAWQVALEEFVDAERQKIHDELHRRAIAGIDKPIFHKGKQVASVTEYSDTLLALMAKMRFGEELRERVDLNTNSGINRDDVHKVLNDPVLAKLQNDMERRLALLASGDGVTPVEGPAAEVPVA